MKNIELLLIKRYGYIETEKSSKKNKLYHKYNIVILSSNFNKKI